MKITLYLLLIAYNLLLLSCRDTVDPELIQSDLLLNCWINSREEQTHEDTLIYRPCDDSPEFPISRYRNQFVLKEHHEASYLILAPDDGHYMTDCTWTYDHEAKKLIFHFPGFNEDAEYSILEIMEDKLVLTSP